jgi:hypothetical protein
METLQVILEFSKDDVRISVILIDIPFTLEVHKKHLLEEVII